MPNIASEKQVSGEKMGLFDSKINYTPNSEY